MEGSIEKKSSTIPMETLPLHLPLHTRVAFPHTWVNRAFALVYSCALLALFYHHITNLVHSTTILVTLTMFLADVVLAFMWANSQGFRMNPVRRQTFPENLTRVFKQADFPALDIFICTADPYKEPPMGVVNTALSVMAYDYPSDKISIYVSDDGGSQLTLFAFMEAAKFASHWLPYCKKNNIMERCPETYFGSDFTWFPDTKNIKLMYETMKNKVDTVVDRGGVSGDYISSDVELQAFAKWTDGFTSRDHPSVIQVLLETGKDKDVTGQPMPNLVYVSREKSKATHHNFKAGALNVLLRVSATMTNAPLILVLDCDMYSNDPQTPLRALCFLMDPSIESKKIAYIQHPQIFHGINKNDTYGAGFIVEQRIVNPVGMDGLGGPPHMGTGAFFRRRAFFGGPSSSSFVTPEAPELSPNHVVKSPIHSQEVLAMAHQVSGCNYEEQTYWGSELGYRYGSLVEDIDTGYKLHIQGWKSVSNIPKRAAFLGDAPMSLHGLLNQTKRWSMGLLDIGFSQRSPIIYGVKYMNFFWSLCYSYYCLWPIRSIPITIYAFLPQLALLNSFSVFPKVTDPWFYLYAFLVVGAYGQDLIEFLVAGETIQRWWNHQRIWVIRGLSSFLFSMVEYLFKCLGISTFVFDITNKVVDNDLSKRYEQGIFEFGEESPLFLPMTMVAIINLVSFIWGIVFLKHRSFEDLFLQMFIAGFTVVNSWPIYEAMVLRKDKGKMPMKVTLTSIVLAWGLYLASSLAF